jgi:hypothetical protein
MCRHKIEILQGLFPAERSLGYQGGGKKLGNCGEISEEEGFCIGEIIPRFLLDSLIDRLVFHLSMILERRLVIVIVARHSAGQKWFGRRMTGGANLLRINQTALAGIAWTGRLTLQASRKDRPFALFGFNRKIIHGGEMNLDWFEY